MEKYWLMKTEPKEYSIDDLESDQETVWNGIRNYQVRNYFRDQFSVGDKIVIYHSSTKNIGAVGEATVIKSAFPDPAQFINDNKYYDPKSNPDKPSWLAVEIKFIKKYPKQITLEQIKSASVMTGSPLIKTGNRLSVIPLTKVQYKFFNSNSKR